MADLLKSTAAVDGRNYIVLVSPEHRNEPMAKFVQVYRMRKDGSAGQKLASCHNAYLKAWNIVRADMVAECERLGFFSGR